MITTVRETYLLGATQAVALLRAPELDQRWTSASVLPGMAVSTLAGHLARCTLLQVGWYLDGSPTTAEVVTATIYYARLQGTTEADSLLNIGVQDRGDDSAAVGRVAWPLRRRAPSTACARA